VGVDVAGVIYQALGGGDVHDHGRQRGGAALGSAVNKPSHFTAMYPTEMWQCTCTEYFATPFTKQGCHFARSFIKHFALSVVKALTKQGCHFHGHLPTLCTAFTKQGSHFAQSKGVSLCTVIHQTEMRRCGDLTKHYL